MSLLDTAIDRGDSQGWTPSDQDVALNKRDDWGVDRAHEELFARFQLGFGACQFALRFASLPVINAAEAGKIAKISAASAYKLVADLERLKIPREITGGKRARTYLFDGYVKFFG